MLAVLSVVASAFLLLFAQCANATAISNAMCKDQARFTCYTVKKHDNWQKLFPDAQKRELVMRLNRKNVSLDRGEKIVIPKDLTTAALLDYAPFPKTISPPGEKVIRVSIDPSVLAWGAYNAQGVLEAWGPVSGGKGWCPDIGRGCHTALGKFAVYQKEGADCKSRKFPVGRGGAPMPYCMFFHGGFALHGSPEVPGYNASHGCVRMFKDDAKWLNKEFVGTENVAVIVSNQP